MLGLGCSLFTYQNGSPDVKDCSEIRGDRNTAALIIWGWDRQKGIWEQWQLKSADAGGQRELLSGVLGSLPPCRSSAVYFVPVSAGFRARLKGAPRPVLCQRVVCTLRTESVLKKRPQRAKSASFPCLSPLRQTRLSDPGTQPPRLTCGALTGTPAAVGKALTSDPSLPR